MKKKTIKTIITVTLITTALIIAFMIGKSQAKTETKIVAEPKQENYINVDTFEDFYTIETEECTELHLYANGNEYIFEN